MIGRRPMAAGRRGPGLLGTAARTAVVAGTASTVSGSVRRRQAEHAQASHAAGEGQAAPGSGGISEGISDVALAKLGQLAELKKQGVLTEAEFSAQKAKILGV
jgi:hypothetical protein